MIFINEMFCKGGSGRFVVKKLVNIVRDANFKRPAALSDVHSWAVIAF